MMPSYKEVSQLVQSISESNFKVLMKVAGYIGQLENEIAELKERMKVLEEKETVR